MFYSGWHLQQRETEASVVLIIFADLLGKIVYVMVFNIFKNQMVVKYCM